VRRIPRNVAGDVDVAGLELAHEPEDAHEHALYGGPVAVWREYAAVGPEIMLGLERFGSVDESFSVEPDPLSNAPVAQCCGPALLRHDEGGAPDHETMVHALVHTAQGASRSRGITYSSSNADGTGMDHHFESYADLLIGISIYIYIYIHVYIYIHTSIYPYAYMYTYSYVCINE